MEEYLGTIQPFGFNFAPRGWALCDGQILSIAAHTALFSLFGTTFGGDGRNTFALPDLRGRSVVKVGAGPGLSFIKWGEMWGSETQYATILEMPTHGHSIIEGNATVTTTTKISTASNDTTNEPDFGNNAFGGGGAFPSIYSEPPVSTDHMGAVASTSMILGSTSNVGGNIPLDIRNPFLGIYMCVAMEGIYPSRG